MNQELKALLEKMVLDLLKQVEEKVPEKGGFPVVYEREEVTDLHIGLSHIILKVTATGVPAVGDERYLELAAVNYPCPYGAESVVGFGYTQDIIACLQDKETLIEKLLQKVPKLADDIDYEERHPYG